MAIYTLNPAQIKKLNKLMGTTYDPTEAVLLEMEEGPGEPKAAVFLKPEAKQIIPVKVAFKL